MQHQDSGDTFRVCDTKSDGYGVTRSLSRVSTVLARASKSLSE
jgi:hypothetical protein